MILPGFNDNINGDEPRHWHHSPCLPIIFAAVHGSQQVILTFCLSITKSSAKDQFGWWLSLNQSASWNNIQAKYGNCSMSRSKTAPGSNSCSLWKHGKLLLNRTRDKEATSRLSWGSACLSVGRVSKSQTVKASVAEWRLWQLLLNGENVGQVGPITQSKK